MKAGRHESKSGASPEVVATSTRLPWRRLAAEAFTITASILLALAVNAWWDGRKDRADERRILLRARDEFALNAQRLDASTQARVAVLAATDSFMKLAVEPARTARSVVVPGRVIGQVLSWNTFDPLNGNTTSLISSGTLRLVRNDSLRILIAGWPDLVRDLNEDEIVDRNAVQDQLAPALFSVLEPQPAYARGQRPASRVTVTWEMYNMVNRRRIASLEILEDMDSAAQHIVRIRSLINRQLEK